MRSPYNWKSVGGVWRNVRWYWRSFWGGLCNVFRWSPVIWGDYDWDWEPLASIMLYKLQRMEPVIRKGHHLDSERDAKRIRQCIFLLKRITADNYGFDFTKYPEKDWVLPTEFNRKRNPSHLRAQKRDMQYLGKLLGKYMLSWWD